MDQNRKNYEEINIFYEKTGVHIYYYSDECLYVANKLNKSGKRYYRCIEKNCKCTGKIESGMFSRITNTDHEHENHRYRAEYERAYYQLKLLVRNERRAVRDIHQDFLRTLSYEASGQLSWSHVRHTLLRIRRELMPACPDIESLINFLENDEDIYNSYGVIRGLPFYIGSINNDMVFANLKLISNIEDSFDMYIDGTFKVLPFGIHQLLVILAEFGGRPRPIAYIVMELRKENHYILVLEHIRNAVLSHDGIVRRPKSVMCDFEPALRSALPKVWENITVNGCFFHMSKALKKNAARFPELSTKIRDKKTIHYRTLKMFMRLSLLPIDKIDAGLEALISHIRLHRALNADFQRFLTYFNSTWMCLYTKEDWCTSALMRRTNNNIEGHNRFIKLVIRINPSPWAFIDGLLNLAYDALASFVGDNMYNFTSQDRSYITEPLTRALLDLEENRITEFDFLYRMARV